jgi:predicted permease
MPPSDPGVFAIFADILLPVFILAALGWTLDRAFSLQLRTLVKLNIYCFVPAFIFVAVLESPEAGWLPLRIIAFTLGVIAAMALMSWTFAAALRLPAGDRRALQLTTMFYNCGNFGLPLIALAYPDGGPGIQVFVVMTMNIATFSLGTLLVAGGHPAGETSSPRRAWSVIARQPSLYAILAALLLRQAPVRVQDIPAIWEPLKHLQGGLIAVALITLGVQLAQYRPAPLRRTVSWALLQRLIGGPLVAALLVVLFRFQSDVAPILILGAGAPTAVNVALLAHEFDADVPFASTMVFYSTLCSLLTVTLTLWVLRLSA